MHAKIREHFFAGQFARPGTRENITAAESALGIRVPKVLIELYLAYDGFRGPGNAQYLFPLLSCSDGGSSLLDMSLHFRNWRSPDLSRFLFFGSSTFDECWGLSLDDSRTIIAYHHHMENEYEVAGIDIYQVMVADEQKFMRVNSD